ncbi:MAG: hypothetical protein SNJ72_03870, partial [Fimbriimonadales bacterium]
KHDLDAHLQRLGNFAWAILRQPDHGIALLDYRGAPIMAQPEGLAALAILASLPASERQSILKRLQKDKTAEISLQRVGIERLDALTKFWRRNTLLPNSPEPFGFRNAWHPRFRVRLRSAKLLIDYDPTHHNLSFRLQMSDQLPDGTVLSHTRSLGTLYLPDSSDTRREMPRSDE